VATGGEAKARIQGGEVRVANEVETRRGRQLRHLEVVEIGGRTAQVFYLDPVLAKQPSNNLP
jgi:ribosome-associated protein